ncbi:glycosyltransferase family 2 protein [Cobetia crustatorum]|uniref:glycosyltransferase family 2 protein n=1 Tax=Cobetia crustatorum TaxID=553385 RepID=UPI00046A03DE|nr:glycosyltransferase family 2 protein [Cobetia crustatorum]
MFLITMAGQSSRFFREGYTSPKFMLPLWGETVFDLSIKSFSNYFSTEDFVFVIKKSELISEFVKYRCSELGILNFTLVELDHDTEGQAETAYLALKTIEKDSPIIIFNIDTFRYNYIKPSFVENCDGYLEVFRGVGVNWSFIAIDEMGKVTKTTEKEPISNLCSDGLYYFKCKSEFIKFFEKIRCNNDKTKGEFYIAPMYNYLIIENYCITYDLIEMHQIDFCGTPDEYEALVARGPLA